MSNNFSINKEFLLKTAKDILEFNSPTGFCFEIMDKIEEIIKPFGYKFERNNKGCGIITVEGQNNHKTVGVCAHVDTLGAMVIYNSKRNFKVHYIRRSYSTNIR